MKTYKLVVEFETDSLLHEGLANALVRDVLAQIEEPRPEEVYRALGATTTRVVSCSLDCGWYVSHFDVKPSEKGTITVGGDAPSDDGAVS